MEAGRQIGIVLLAAGNSTRMGRPKQLLPFRGTTLLRHAVRIAMETQFAPIVVVLGAEAELCQSEIAGLPVHPIINSAWAEGMGASIRVGMIELLRRASSVEAILIMLHDQPLITAQRLCALVQEWKRDTCAVASFYGKSLGVPAVFSRELFGELQELRGNQGARHLLETFRDRVVLFNMPEALHDIDTPADYERVR